MPSNTPMPWAECDHIVPPMKLVEGMNGVAGPFALLLAPFLAFAARAGKQGEFGPGIFQPGRKPPGSDRDHAGRCAGRLLHEFGPQPLGAQVLGKHTAGLIPTGEHHAGIAPFEKGGRILGKLGYAALPGGGLPRIDGDQLPHRRVVPGVSECIKVNRPARFKFTHHFPGGQGITIQPGAEQPLLKQSFQILRVLPMINAVFFLDFGWFADKDKGVLRVLVQGGGRIVQQGEIAVGPVNGYPFPQAAGVLTSWARMRSCSGLQRLASFSSPRGQPLGIVDHHLGGRRDANVFEIVHPPLGKGVKAGERVDLIPHRIRPVPAGPGRARKNPGFRPCRGQDCPGPSTWAGAHIARAGQPGAQGGRGDLLPNLDPESMAQKLVGRQVEIWERASTQQMT